MKKTRGDIDVFLQKPTKDIMYRICEQIWDLKEYENKKEAYT